MKKIILFTCLLNLPFLLLAQRSYKNLKRKVDQLSEINYQIFEMHKEDTIVIGYLSSINPEIRNGEFKFFTNKGELIAIGNYKQDLPSGIWYYHKGGEVLKEINYDKTLEFLKSDTTKYKAEYFMVEQMPKFQGKSQDNFRIYIRENLIYPIYARTKGLEGKVMIQFTVNEEGVVGGVSVQRTTGNVDFNMEAIRIVSESPNWEPGKQKNIAVPVRFVFPVVFELK